MSLSVQEVRKRAEGIAAAAAAVVAPCCETLSTLLSIREASFKTAWRGKATCASFALRFAPAFSYASRICVLSMKEEDAVVARVFSGFKGCNEEYFSEESNRKSVNEPCH